VRSRGLCVLGGCAFYGAVVVLVLEPPAVVDGPDPDPDPPEGPGLAAVVVAVVAVVPDPNGSARPEPAVEDVVGPDPAVAAEPEVEVEPAERLAPGTDVVATRRGGALVEVVEVVGGRGPGTVTVDSGRTTM
jgi:hypothetical protein